MVQVHDDRDLQTKHNKMVNLKLIFTKMFINFNGLSFVSFFNRQITLTSLELLKVVI